MAGQHTAEYVSRKVESFEGLPLGYMPAIILAVVAVVCVVAWFIAKRKLGDK